MATKTKTDRPDKLARQNAPASGRVARGAADTKQPTSPRWTINRRLLIWTGVVIVVVTGALYFWGSYQTQLQADALLEMADKQKANGELEKAASTMRRYVKLRPDDINAYVDFAHVYNDSNQPLLRKIDYLSDAINRVKSSPETDQLLQDPLRRKLTALLRLRAEYSRKVAYFQDAITCLGEIQQPTADDLGLLAQCLIDMGRIDPTTFNREVLVERLTAAIDAGSTDADLTLALAGLYRDGQYRNENETRRKQAEADDLLYELTQADSENPFAWLARFRFAMESTPPDEIAAEEYLASALEHIDAGGERRFVVWVFAAVFAFQQKDFDTTISRYQSALECAPDPASVVRNDDLAMLHNAYRDCAWLMRSQGRLDESIEVLKAGRDYSPFFHRSLSQFLVDYLTEAQRLDEALDVLGEIKADIDSTASYDNLDEKDQVDTRYHRLEARLFQALGEYREAIASWDALLVASALSLRTEEVNRTRADAYLNQAICLINLEEFDTARQRIAEAAKLPIAQSRIQYMFGRLTERQGLLSTALAHYEEALKQTVVHFPARESYARLLIRVARVSGAPADWRRFEKLVEETPLLAPADQERWAMLRADAATIQQDHEKAATILNGALKTSPDSTPLKEALTLNALNAGNDLVAAGYLEALRTAAPERYHVMRYLMEMRAGNLDLAEQELHQAIERALGPARRQLERALAEFELNRLDQLEQGRQRLARLIESAPSAQLSDYRRLAELAITADDFEDAARYQQIIQSIEGASEDGIARYLDGRIALKQGDVRTARQIAERLSAVKSRWAPAALLTAMVAEQEERMADAVLAYQDAVRFGNTDAAIAAKVFQLLSELNRYTDANEFLQRLTPESRGIGLANALKDQEFEKVVTFAKADLDTDTKSARNWIRYGNSLLLVDRMDEAEDAFQTAIQIEPTNPVTLIQLVGLRTLLFRRTGTSESRESVLEAIEQLDENADASEEDLAFLLGQCYQRIGDLDAADDAYRLALRLASPDEVLPMIRVAAPFFSDRDRAYAIGLLESALEIDPGAQELVRLLAVIHSEAGTADDWQQAWDIIAQESPSVGADGAQDRDSLNNRRILALMLLRTGDPDRQGQAGDMLEDIIRDSIVKLPADVRLLAEIHEQTGNLEQAIEKMSTIATGPEASLDSRKYYIQLLIQHGDFDQAETILANLEKSNAVNPGFVIGSRCEIASAKGSEDAIDGLLSNFIEPELEKNKEDQLAQVQIILFAAELAERFNRADAAEQWHKRRLDLDPLTFSSYGVWLAKQGRAREAVSLALSHAQPDDVGSMIGLTTVLIVSGAPRQEVDRATPVLDQAMLNLGEEVDFLISMATLRQVQRDSREAVILYERALQRSEGTNVTALNNLALLLSEDTKRSEEALNHINRAINARGTDNTSLLDTKASVLMTLDRYNDALSILQRIVLRIDDNPVYFLHLAECQRHLGDPQRAKRNLETAERLGIEATVLTDPDMAMLQKLRIEFSESDE